MAWTFKLSLALLALGGIACAQNDSLSAPTQKIPSAPSGVEPIHSKSYDPLLDLPPLKNNTVSLLGGTVTKLDRVRDRIAIRAFGGEQQTLAFDVRTKFYRGSEEVRDKELQTGQRVYIDTMLNGSQVFAKNIWIEQGEVAGSGAGQIVSYDQRKGILEVRDQLTAETLQFHLTPKTRIQEGNEIRSANVLVPGALVSLTFSPGQKQTSLDAVLILARPGYSVSFFGAITFLDLSRNFVAVLNRTDGKTYEIHVEGIAPETLRKLHPGLVIGVAAVFDGKQYMARTLAFAAPAGTQQ